MERKPLLRGSSYGNGAYASSSLGRAAAEHADMRFDRADADAANADAMSVLFRQPVMAQVTVKSAVCVRVQSWRLAVCVRDNTSVLRCGISRRTRSDARAVGGTFCRHQRCPWRRLAFASRLAAGAALEDFLDARPALALSPCKSLCDVPPLR
eukprot:6199844-Pleurochrysis_carterae.AAC.8